jgi:hypothetical protein
MVFRKSSDFWFALIFVGPDTVEFLFIDSAVICRLKLAFNLSQQSSHIPPPQTVPLALIFRKVEGNWLYVVRTEGPDVETQYRANLDPPNGSRSSGAAATPRIYAGVKTTRIRNVDELLARFARDRSG